MRRLTTGLLLLAAIGLLAGCGEPYAAIETSHPPLGHRKVETRHAAFQFSKGRAIEIVMAREFALPGGEAVPDVEYLHIALPEEAGTYQVGEPGVAITRLVRIEREEFLYRAVSGNVKYRFNWLSHDRVSVTFDVETDLVPADPSRRRWHLSGEIKAREDVAQAQGLVNKYGDAVKRIEAAAAAAKAAPAPGPDRPPAG